MQAKTVSLLLVICVVSCCEGVPTNGEEEEISFKEEDDAGKPLFLTPLIEEGKLEEARKKATVKPFLPDIHSYSGFLTVNKDFGSNLFFWFFRCATDWQNAPVSVWLQGGPGGSSLFGLFVEHGPILIRNGKLYKRIHSWHKTTNIIYIDNPVGSGFSFTNADEGYARNQTIIGEQLYSAVKQFFQLFPNLQSNEFYITGESYAGKYVPALAYSIHTHNPTSDIKINLKGLFIGNGLTDPVNMLKYGDYLYQLGLIDKNNLKIFHKYEKEIKEDVKNENWSEATEKLSQLVLGYVYYPQGSLFGNLTGFTEHYNYVDVHSGDWTQDHKKFVNSDKFHKAVHVGDKQYQNGTKTALILKEDILKTVIEWVEELLDYYRITFYNGQLDIICAYPLTVNFLQKMKWSGSEEYKTAVRKIWKVGKDIGGYYKTTRNLTEVLVRNAGHLVPTDRPLWGHMLYYSFINNLLQ